MFERYTENARRALFFARYEASQLGAPSIETHHLLLGLIREGQELTARIFAEAALSLPDVRREIEQIPPPRRSIFSSVEIPFSADTKRALHAAAEEAERFLHDYIGTEHLLLGLLRIDESPAAKVLTGKGLGLTTVREAMVARPAIVGSRGPGAPPMRTLKAAIVYAWDGDERYVDMPDDEARRGFVMIQPDGTPAEANKRRLRDAIEKQFGLTVTREPRAVDVYVLTAAPGGPGPALRHQGGLEGGGGGFVSAGFSTRRGVPSHDRHLISIDRFSATGMPFQVICQSFEAILGRPLVNEANLPGVYDLELTSTPHTVDAFIRALHEEAGLIVAPATRDISYLVARRA